MVSKKAIYNLIPQKYYPITELIRGVGIKKLRRLSKSFHSVPFFVKPILVCGAPVKKKLIRYKLEQYAIRANFDFLVQDLIPFQNEVGIFTFVIQMKKRKNNRYCF
jgi:hypothetical protein